MRSSLPRRILCSTVVAVVLGVAGPGVLQAEGFGGAPRVRETPYYLVLLVHAAGLDYQDEKSLLRSLYKRSRFKGGFLGHSWVLLSGIENGRQRVVEVGLSPKGEGSIQFFRGVLDLAEYGYANPTEEQRRHPRHEPDPISYLWRDHGNGYLQPASEARISPTYAAKLDLDAAQYRAIRERLDPALPDHERFQLTGRQCSSFLAEIAALAGVSLRHQVTIPIPRRVEVGGRQVRLWTDPAYASMTLSSPDVLEQELRRLVAAGGAEDVLAWYLAGGARRAASAL
jgi:hypothetical protein